MQIAENHAIIRESSFVLFHVIRCSAILPKIEWLEKAMTLKDAALKQGLYPVRPLMMTVDPVPQATDLRRFTYYLSLNGAYSPATGGSITYQESLICERTLALRHYQMDKPFTASHQELINSARAQGLQTADVFYHVMIPIYGDWIAEIHLPVEK